MHKVVYNIKKYLKKGVIEHAGSGYITDTDLLIACNTKDNKPYIRVFQDAVKSCHQMTNKPNEFSGFISEVQNVMVENEDGSATKVTLYVDYKIWYKIVD